MRNARRIFCEGADFCGGRGSWRWGAEPVLARSTRSDEKGSRPRYERARERERAVAGRNARACGGGEDLRAARERCETPFGANPFHREVASLVLRVPFFASATRLSLLPRPSTTTANRTCLPICRLETRPRVKRDRVRTPRADSRFTWPRPTRPRWVRASTRPSTGPARSPS